MRLFSIAAVLCSTASITAIAVCSYAAADKPWSDSQPTETKQAKARDAAQTPPEKNYIQFRQYYIESAINMGTQAWTLLEGLQMPGDYNALVESGALPIIYLNPYTGEDMDESREYSPGDIWFHFPTPEEPNYRLWIHLGEMDINYDSQLAESGEVVPMEFGPEFRTDGHTIFIEYELSPEEITSMEDVGDIGAGREAWNFPADDTARLRIYTVFCSVQDLLTTLHADVPSNPESIDEVVALVGRKNPVSWTNPYTGEPMRNVPWVTLPFYSDNISVPEESPSPQDGIDAEALVGNYSFVSGQHPIYGGQARFPVVIQYYFYLPSGEVASYLTSSFERLE